jgi:4-hydroxy-tetrahydrodipicolinate synthase
MTFKPRGIIPPTITPFDIDGNLDERALVVCTEFWIKNGIHALAPCGSNSEAPYLTRDERKKILRIMIGEVNERVPIIAGTGALTTRETITLTKDAETEGADAALVLTPYYYKLSHSEIIEHYREVIKATSIPIIIYNVPIYTGVNLPPTVIEQIAESDRIIGVKDTSGSIGQIAELIRRVGSKISVLGGTTDVIFPTLSLGGKGALIGIANVIPKLCSEIYELVAAGKFEEAREIHLKILPLNEVLFKKYNPATVKEALNLMGIPAGYPRRPMLKILDDEKKDVENALRNLELID